MTHSNLATAIPMESRPLPDVQPRLQIVSRGSPEERSAAEQEYRYADNVDTLIQALAVAAGILGYAAFGILSVAGR